MISIGIDISKGKSTVCMLKPYGEIVASPFEVMHTESELKNLIQMIQRLDGEIRIVMEATGIYHLPVLQYFRENNLFVSVINPYQMKQYRAQGLRRVKTDKADSMKIAQYGIDHWLSLVEYIDSEEVYKELSVLSRQYRHFMRVHVTSLQGLKHLLDYTMPGIKKELASWNNRTGRDKLSDFVDQYWHYDNITKKSGKQFTSNRNFE